MYKPATRCILAALLLLLPLFPATLSADNVPRKAPAAYYKEIEPLLTKIDGLLKVEKMPQAMELGGEVLLYEKIVQVQEDGRRLAAIHVASRAATEAGTASLERDVHPFNKRRQKVYLPLAQTITADGKKQPVKSDAAFFQTPQRSADESLYDDQSEAVSIFPDIKPGSVTQQIIVEEDVIARIPGHYTAFQSLAYGWPTLKMRLVVELPKKMADELITSQGEEPQRKEEVAGGKRVRLTWEKEKIAPLPNEPQRPTVDQTGPVLRISTLPNWEAFLNWYWPQVEPQLILDEALRKNVDAWTKDKTSPDQILSELLRRAADDVRYVGLEFGNGDLIPRSVAKTWENQYGDCKDKACLLVAMLKHKGITAYPALINTNHPGRIDRSVPDFRQFTHCIVAVEKEGAKDLIFCDPTVPGILPGGIAAVDGDRDVLLVKPSPNGVQWARTPVHDFGEIRFSWDATMDAVGGLSGWCTLEAQGNNAANYGWQETKETRENLLERMRNNLSGFHQNIRVVDVRKHPWEPGKPYKLEIFFLIPGSGQMAVSFPANLLFVPEPGNKRERQTAWPFWKERVHTTARIKLPQGRVPDKVPAPYKSESRHAAAEAAWQYKDGTLETSFYFDARENTVAAPDWPAFADQVSHFRAWILRGLQLKEGTEAPMAEKSTTPELDFVKMPSALGQIDFIEGKFPANGNAKLRREALEKALTVFAGEKEMLLMAGWRLASMDITEDRAADGLRRIDSFLESCRGSATQEEAAAADYMRGLALRKLERTAEAMKIWDHLVDDKAVSGFRRTWAWWQIVRHHSEKDAPTAMAAAEKGMALRSENEEILYPFWIKLKLAAKSTADVEKKLRAIVRDHPESAPRIFSYILDYNGDLTPAENEGLLQSFKDLENADQLGSTYAASLKAAEERQAMHGLREKLVKKADAILQTYEEFFSTQKLPESAKTSTELMTFVEELNSKGTQPALAAKCTFEALRRCTDESDPASLAWDCCRYAEWLSRAVASESTQAIYSEAFALTQLLPTSNLHALNSLHLYAQSLNEAGKWAAAAKLLESVTKSITTPEGLAANQNIFHVYGLALEGMANWKDATVNFEKLLAVPDARASAYWHLSSIAVARRDYEVAFTHVDALRKLPKEQLETGDLAESIQSLLSFTSNKEGALAWWQAEQQWWPAWVKAAAKADPKRRFEEMTIVEIPSIQTWTQELILAISSKKDAAIIAKLHAAVSAARVHPMVLVELKAMTEQIDIIPVIRPIVPHLKVVLEKAEPHFPSHDLPSYSLWLGVECRSAMKRKEFDKIRQLAEKFSKLNAPKNAESQAIAVFWLTAVFASKADAEAALKFAALHPETDLADDPNRPNFVFVYASLLLRENRQKEAKSLLEKNLSTPNFPENHPLAANLKQLLEATKKAGGAYPETLAELSIAPTAAKWLTRPERPWLAYLKKMLDQNATKLDDFLKPKPRVPRPLVSIQTIDSVWADMMQAAANGTFPKTDNDGPLRRTIADLILAEKSEGTMSRALSSLLSVPDFDPSEQSLFVSLLIPMCKDTLSNRMKRSWMRLPAAARIKESNPSYHAVLEQFAQVDPLDASALESLAQNLPFDPKIVHQAVCVEVAQQLLRHGKIQSVEKLVAKWASTTESSNLTPMTEALAWAKRLEKTHDALRQITLRHFPDWQKLTEPTDVLKKLGNTSPERITLLSREAAIAVQGWMVQKNVFERADLSFWESLFSHGGQLPADFRREMAQAAVTQAEAAKTHLDALSLLDIALDADDKTDAALRAEAYDAMLKHTDIPANTAEILRFEKDRMGLRNGTILGDVSLMKKWQTEQTNRAAGLDAVRAAAAEGNRDKVRKIVFQLEKLPEEDIPEQDMNFHLILQQAHNFMENVEQSNFYAGFIKGQFPAKFAHAWAMKDTAKLKSLVSAAYLSNQPTLIPETFLPDLKTWLENHLSLARLECMGQILHQKWDAVEQTSAAALKEFPTWHEFKYYHGLACFKLGRKPEAKQSLTDYIAIVHNDTDVARAKAMLKELDKTKE